MGQDYETPREGMTPSAYNKTTTWFMTLTEEARVMVSITAIALVLSMSLGAGIGYACMFGYFVGRLAPTLLRLLKEPEIKGQD